MRESGHTEGAPPNRHVRWRLMNEGGRAPRRAQLDAIPFSA
jgi:hypothetical protein